MKENTFAVVRNRLQSCGQEAVAAFEASAFGSYLGYYNSTVQSQRCMHYLLSRQVIGVPDPDPNSIWFKVHDQIARFSRVEFALVSGLRFGASEFDPYIEHEIPETSLYTRRFKNKRMKPKELWDLFTNRNWDIGTPEDCVKLSKVLVAAIVVLGYNPNQWKIPDWIWALVEDAQQWDQFPWGSLSYQILTRAVTNVKKELTTNTAYHFHANTLAFLVHIHFKYFIRLCLHCASSFFLVHIHFCIPLYIFIFIYFLHCTKGWIFNAFPELGRNIGGLRQDFEAGKPRGLMYIYHRSYHPIDINEVLSSFFG